MQMAIQEQKILLQSRIWQALAQSQLDLTSLSAETLSALVNLVSEAALLEMDAQLAQTLKSAEAEPPPTATATLTAQPSSSDEAKEQEGEQLLWEGRPLLSLSRYFQITSERVRISDGLLSKKRTDIELVKIQDVNLTQRLGERVLNIGDITIRSHDITHPVITLDNISEPDQVHEILRRARQEARKKANFSYREEM